MPSLRALVRDLRKDSESKAQMGSEQSGAGRLGAQQAPPSGSGWRRFFRFGRSFGEELAALDRRWEARFAAFEEALDARFAAVEKAQSEALDKAIASMEARLDVCFTAFKDYCESQATRLDATATFLQNFSNHLASSDSTNKKETPEQGETTLELGKTTTPELGEATMDLGKTTTPEMGKATMELRKTTTPEQGETTLELGKTTTPALKPPRPPPIFIPPPPPAPLNWIPLSKAPNLERVSEESESDEPKG